MAETKGSVPMRARALLIAIMLIARGATALAETYTDSYFEFRAAMPKEKVVCLPRENTSDHGFVVLWETKDCNFISSPTGIYVYASHNFDRESNTTPELGKLLCDGNAVSPSPFVVSGFRFYQCKSKTDEGRLGPSYFVLRHVKGGYPESEPTYGVWLICPHDDCRKLMPMTRWIFVHMRFIRQIY
jgi:hypothetical protein